ncbi:MULTISPECIES: hypothetical protein [unclassified Acinetobacter]|uniref:hypothetical protein n=1 Tax=unclassified Acinetobacter TaxID=196816 RepID=UPI0035B965AC
MSLLKSPVWFSLCIATVALTACDRNNPLNLTPEQHWQSFCSTYQGAAYNIMHDRQNGIAFEKALAHVEKLPQGQEREMLIAVVKDAYNQPQKATFDERQKAKEDFRQGKYEQCLATPHSERKVPAKS